VFESSIDPTVESIRFGITSKPSGEESEELFRVLVRVWKSSWDDFQQRSNEDSLCVVEVAISRRSRSRGLPSTAVKTLDCEDINFLPLDDIVGNIKITR
jgi:hypothetical protein